MYDGSIPHSRAEDLDEERRLLYVGMTRAQGLLYLSCPVRQTGQEQTTLSRFVSGRKLQKLFSNRGPDLAFNRNTIPELARILRRPCPQPADVAATHALLERLEDDRYPATREEIDDDSSKWGASYDANFISAGPNSDTTQPSFKRRKFETATSSFAGGKVSIGMHQTSGFSTATTTMQTLKPGFTSARALGDLQAMQQEAAHIRTLARAPPTQSTSSHASRAATPAEPKPARPNKPAKPRATGQNAITNFFQRTTRTASEDLGEAYGGDMPGMLPRGHAMRSAHAPLLDISNVQHAIPCTPSLSSPCLAPAAATREIPAHKLHARPMPSKPRRVGETEAEAEAAASARYFLLSSSPVRQEVEVGAPCEPSDACGIVNGGEGDTIMARLREARPPATLHVTSMARLQDAGAQRKTLGTRRSMQGWSVKRCGMPKPRLP